MTADLVDISTGEIASTPLGVCPVCKQTAFTDLVQALGELQEPSKGGKANVGNRGTYTYLTLPDLLTAVRGPLAAHHLAVMQEVTNTEHTVSVVTVLLHASGYAFRSPTLTLPAGAGAQAVGSATTYARRYTLAAMVGLAGAEDDDAQSTTTQPGRPTTVTGGTDTRGEAASPPSRKLMWTLLRKTGMSDDEVRMWVGSYLQIATDWHTEQLTQAQVSGVINALKARLLEQPAQGGDTTPPKNWGDE